MARRAIYQTVTVGNGEDITGEGEAEGDVATSVDNEPAEDDTMTDAEEHQEEPVPTIVEPEINTADAREAFWKELVKAREIERKLAIAEGKMDDPMVPKRLEDAITIVGTCMDMCPRFERYRRERENNLFEWELIPGTKRVDHNRAVKMYERAAGDKTLPSDLRPPKVLRRTLDYLFHDLLPRGGFQGTFNFIRDRSRSVRNDFTMQHITGPSAIECHDRCARFHILGMHLQRDVAGFQYEMEDQQLMNTLQSLKEFYDANRGSYQSPTELEMRVYHRLIHIRDQVERPEQVPVPGHITEHPVFKLVTQFRLHVQAKSAPITKKSKLSVGAEGMQIFGELARQLSEQGSAVMVYLVACILERLFGKDTIEDIETIKGGLTLSDIIDGISSHGHMGSASVEVIQDRDHGVDEEGEYDEQEYDEEEEHYLDEEPAPTAPTPMQASLSWPSSSNFTSQPSAQSSSIPPVVQSAFGNLKTTTTNVFGGAVFGAPAGSSQSAPTSVFGNLLARDNNSSNTSSFGKPVSLATAPPLPAPADERTAPNGNTAPATSIFGKPFSLATAPPLSTSVSEPTLANGSTSAQPSIFGSKPFSLAMAPPLATSSNEPTTKLPPKAPTPPFSSNATTSQPNFFNKPAPPLASLAPPTQATTSFSSNIFASAPLTNTFPTSSNLGFSFPTTTKNGNASLNPQAPPFQPSEGSKPTGFFTQPPPVPSSSFSLPPFSITSASGAAPSAPSPQASTTPARVPEAPVNGNASTVSSSSGALFGRRNSDHTPSPSLMRKSSSGSKSTTPPTTRPVAPPMLRIDTNTSTGSMSTSSSFVGNIVGTAGAVNSPREPPQLARKAPVSLPETPTLPPNPLLGHLRNTLTGSPSGSMNQSQEILSPLIMGSPTTGSLQNLRNFSPLSTPSIPRRFSIRCPSPTEGSMATGKGISAILSNNKGKGKAPERQQYTDAEEEEMEQTAVRFEQRSVLVKEYFKRWVDRTTERLMYLEARRHGDEYRDRLKQSGNGSLRKSVNGRASVKDNALAALDKKRRMSRNGAENDVEMRGASPLKKRPRKSEYVPPRTDEELARRLKENHEEQEKRWAQGSFLQVIRSHVKSLNPSVLKLPWNIWISMNPESDATAIWLERKFDIPASGLWATESVYSIPLSSATVPGDSGYPGLIVFECTPLSDLTDDLEKKYRILDDCARLREVIKTLSPRRYFIPSLLVICWCEPEELSKDSDFFNMVTKLIADSTLGSYHVLPMTATTKELDTKLGASLKSMTIDSDGKLIQTLSLRELFKLFEPIYTSFVSEWIENSTINGNFYWSLYAQLVQASVDLLNTVSQLVRTLLEVSGPQDEYPPFDPAHIDDSETCYDEVNDWLSSLTSRDDARLVATDLHSHRNIGQEFPARIFMDHLFELTEIRFERLFPRIVDIHRPILITSINSAIQTLKDALRPHQLKLSQMYNFSVRRSPKRRAFSTTTSEVGSVKRARLSASVTSIDEDEDLISEVVSPPTGRETASPTPSNISTATTEAPSVTVAMLRALTRDIKKKYGGS
ncbi:hypothetical protein D9619_008595 [Psilocybe cf. subviscida]|uniref:SAC3/GANP/THP3 conserved domain-containing protein n=1 Tax=Psilocybe cf. subviscida TaxID=2480587 RepID=A0A8H5BAJ3_9AGAR|nr:hypothetical protein D9619_008595 [Psilocybe cf. subviscida]